MQCNVRSQQSDLVLGMHNKCIYIALEKSGLVQCNCNSVQNHIKWITRKCLIVVMYVCILHTNMSRIIFLFRLNTCMFKSKGAYGWECLIFAIYAKRAHVYNYHLTLSPFYFIFVASKHLMAGATSCSSADNCLSCNIGSHNEIIIIT